MNDATPTHTQPTRSRNLLNTELLVETLRSRMQDTRTSTRSLARALRVSEAMISRMLANRHKPNAEHIARILQWMNLPIQEFYSNSYDRGETSKDGGGAESNETINHLYTEDITDFDRMNLEISKARIIISNSEYILPELKQSFLSVIDAIWSLSRRVQETNATPKQSRLQAKIQVKSPLLDELEAEEAEGTDEGDDE